MDSMYEELLWYFLMVLVAVFVILIVKCLMNARHYHEELRLTPIEEIKEAPGAQTSLTQDEDADYHLLCSTTQYVSVNFLQQHSKLILQKIDEELPFPDVKDDRPVLFQKAVRRYTAAVVSVLMVNHIIKLLNAIICGVCTIKEYRSTENVSLVDIGEHFILLFDRTTISLSGRIVNAIKNAEITTEYPRRARDLIEVVVSLVRCASEQFAYEEPYECASKRSKRLNARRRLGAEEIAILEKMLIASDVGIRLFAVSCRRRISRDIEEAIPPLVNYISNKHPTQDLWKKIYHQISDVPEQTLCRDTHIGESLITRFPDERNFVSLCKWICSNFASADDARRQAKFRMIFRMFYKYEDRYMFETLEEEDYKLLQQR